MPPAEINTPQMTAENFRQLAAARTAVGKIRRAVTTARIDGYSVAIFGLLTCLFDFSSVAYLAVGVLMMAIGVIEVWGADQLRLLKVSAVRVLTVNQLFFAGLLLIYAAVQYYLELIHPSKLPGLSPSYEQMIGSMDLTHPLMLLVYGTVAIAGAVEAGMAWYYHTRGEHLAPIWGRLRHGSLTCSGRGFPSKMMTRACKGRIPAFFR